MLNNKDNAPDATNLLSHERRRKPVIILGKLWMQLPEFYFFRKEHLLTYQIFSRLMVLAFIQTHSRKKERKGRFKNF